MYASYHGKDSESILITFCVFAYILFSFLFPFIDKKDMLFGGGYIAFDESEDNHVARFTAMIIASVLYLLLLIFGLLS